MPDGCLQFEDRGAVMPLRDLIAPMQSAMDAAYALSHICNCFVQVRLATALATANLSPHDRHNISRSNRFHLRVGAYIARTYASAASQGIGLEAFIVEILEQGLHDIEEETTPRACGRYPPIFPECKLAGCPGAILTDAHERVLTKGIVAAQCLWRFFFQTSVRTADGRDTEGSFLNRWYRGRYRLAKALDGRAFQQAWFTPQSVKWIEHAIPALRDRFPDGEGVVRNIDCFLNDLSVPRIGRRPRNIVKQAVDDVDRRAVRAKEGLEVSHKCAKLEKRVKWQNLDGDLSAAGAVVLQCPHCGKRRPPQRGRAAQSEAQDRQPAEVRELGAHIKAAADELISAAPPGETRLGYQALRDALEGGDGWQQSFLEHLRRRMPEVDEARALDIRETCFRALCERIPLGQRS